MGNKRIYKYQVNAYFLYKRFGTRPFYSAEAEEALKKDTPYKVGSLTLTGLRKRRYIKDWLKKEDVIDEVENYSGRKNYQRFTEKGLAYVQWLDDNRHLITKYLLKL